MSKQDEEITTFLCPICGKEQEECEDDVFQRLQEGWIEERICADCENNGSLEAYLEEHGIE